MGEKAKGATGTMAERDDRIVDAFKDVLTPEMEIGATLETWWKKARRFASRLILATILVSSPRKGNSFDIRFPFRGDATTRLEELTMFAIDSSAVLRHRDFRRVKLPTGALSSFVFRNVV